MQSRKNQYRNRQWLISQKAANVPSLKNNGSHYPKNNDFSFVSAASGVSSTDSQHPLYVLFILMMLSNCVIGQVEAVAQKPWQPKIKIHGHHPQSLPGPSMCVEKLKGISNGMVCHSLVEQEKTTFYLKKLSPLLASEKPCLSLEYFNAQFASSVIGVKSPDFRFFQVDNIHTNGPEFFMGSREMKITFFKSSSEIIEKVSGDEIAKLVISKLFISDLHFDNYAFDNNGEIVLVDLDSNKFNPTRLGDYLFTAIIGIANPRTPPLSLDNMDLIIKLLNAMKSRKLPEFSDQFGLDVDSYQQLLDIYIKCFKETKEFFSFIGFDNPLVIDGIVSKSAYSYAVNVLLRNVISDAFYKWRDEISEFTSSASSPYCFV